MMLCSRQVRKLVVVLTTVSVALPAQTLMAADRGAPAQNVPGAGLPASIKSQDVELGADGTLRGYFVDPEQGAGREGVQVTLHQNKGTPLATSVTGKNGEFAFTGLKGGTYQVVADQKHLASYRAWMPGTAPPRTSPHANFIAGDATRADFAGASSLWFAGLSPAAQLAIIAAIGAAIAIPFIVANDDDDRRQADPNGNPQ